MITQWSRSITDHNMADDMLVEKGNTVAGHPWWGAAILCATLRTGKG